MIPEGTLLIGTDPVLEARLAVPDEPRGGVVLCHPHPLYGGDMDSPVVTRAAAACQAAGLATLRFNFRGVGASGGIHGEGLAEQDDVRAALESLAQRRGLGALGIVGYSFGAWVAAVVGRQDSRVAGLALIAPPVRLHDLGCLEGKQVPILIVGGDRDSYCPAPDIQRIAVRCPSVTPVVVKGADHFFAGALDALAEAIERWAQALPTRS